MKIFNHFQNLPESFFKKSIPTQLKNSRIIAFSQEVANLIELEESELKSELFLNKITGKEIDEKFCYLAQCYSGHQFGHFVDILGDGRAVLLTQIINKKQQKFDLVLKGSGITPFSRTYISHSDGKSVLRSAIREFLASESLFHLNIPTSRALCLIASDDFAMREKLEPASQIIRVAPSHIRFGTFEYFFYNKQSDNIKILADYAIENYFPKIQDDEQKYLKFLEEVIKSTAQMVAKWQAFGFCHGVMNTDNMSIHGITFDFGPFGFLDNYNPHHICNFSDINGRYSFINQLQSAFWNLHAFAITLSSLISMEEQKEILQKFEKYFEDEYLGLMARKLGFKDFNSEVTSLIYEILEFLFVNKIDYSFFFRNFLEVEFKGFSKLKVKHKRLLQKNNIGLVEAKNLANKINPKFILRNYLLENAIQKAYLGDFSEVLKLQKIMQNPFDEQKEFDDYSKIPPKWANELKVSCSS